MFNFFKKKLNNVPSISYEYKGYKCTIEIDSNDYEIRLMTSKKIMIDC